MKTAYLCIYFYFLLLSSLSHFQHLNAVWVLTVTFLPFPAALIEQLKKGKVHFGSQFQLQTIMVGKLRQQRELCVYRPMLHYVYRQKQRARGAVCCLVPLLHLHSPQFPAQEMMPSTMKMSLSTTIKVIKIISSRQDQSLSTRCIQFLLRLMLTLPIAKYFTLLK